MKRDLNHLPNRVPEAHFKTLLAYWETNAAKKTSLQNSRNRQEQDSIRTAGSVPYAVINDQMLREDGVTPSKRKMFEKTRSQKERKTFDQPDDNTHENTQAMRQLEESQADYCHKDLSKEVTGDNHGRVPLLGRGVSCKKLREKGTGTLVLPKEIMESIKSLTADVQKDLNSEEEEESVIEKQAPVAHVAEMQSVKDAQISGL